MELSIVSTLYRSAPFIQEFYSRSVAAASKVTDDFEIILVNDGCPDLSLTIAKEIAARDSRVRVIDLSKNYGHSKALMTGLICSKGDQVFLIDCDLEEQPEMLSVFWNELKQNPELDVVYGVQAQRKGGWFEQITGSWYYTIFNWLSDQKMPVNITNLRLMRRHYVDNLIRFRETDIVFSAVAAMAGFRQKPLVIQKLSRKSSSYTLAKKIDLVLNSVTSFSAKPLVFVFYTGVIILLCSMTVIAGLLCHKIFLSGTLEGWTSIVASIWLVGGIMTFSIGLCGLYLCKIYQQVKDRPFVIIRKEYAGDSRQIEQVLSEDWEVDMAGRH